MLAQIHDNTHKAYVALQSYVTSPSNIPIPGVVHTDRPKLTREQMVARIREQNTDPRLDINRVSAQKEQKPPVMLQKPAKTANGFEKFDYDLPMLPKEQPVDRVQRALSDTVAQCVYRANVTSPTVQDHFDTNESNALSVDFPIRFEFISKRNPKEVCYEDVPEFVVCKYPSNYWGVAWDYHGPRFLLNYHNYTDLPDPYPDVVDIGGFCGMYQACPPPETTPDGINEQINQTLAEYSITRVILSQGQLDSYLQWRRENGATEDLEYIRVSDREISSTSLSSVPQPSSQLSSVPQPSSQQAETLEQQLKAGLISGFVLMGLAGTVGLFAHARCKASSPDDSEKQDSAPNQSSTDSQQQLQTKPTGNVTSNKSGKSSVVSSTDSSAESVSSSSSEPNQIITVSSSDSTSQE